MENKGGGGFLTFVVGVLTGAFFASLIISQEEKDVVKERMTDTTDAMTEKVKEASDTMRQKVDEVVEFSKQKLDEQKSIWADAIEAGKDAIKKERELLNKDEDPEDPENNNNTYGSN